MSSQNVAVIHSDSLSPKSDIAKEKEFMFIGQIEEHKGVFDLFTAFKALKNEIDIPIKLTYIGSGQALAKLRKTAANINNVTILGRIDDRRLLEKKISKSFCIVVPSLCYENSPTVIYEAFTLGIPFIASNIGGIPELSGILNGILYEAGDILDLKEKMKNLIKHPGHVGESENRQKLIQELNLDNYLDKLGALFICT
jgi:glycosyltransferase involved in cell wall biosynthesis